jgi:hypothetical protein
MQQGGDVGQPEVVQEPQDRLHIGGPMGKGIPLHKQANTVSSRTRQPAAAAPAGTHCCQEASGSTKGGGGLTPSVFKAGHRSNLWTPPTCSLLLGTHQNFRVVPQRHSVVEQAAADGQHLVVVAREQPRVPHQRSRRRPFRSASSGALPPPEVQARLRVVAHMAGGRQQLLCGARRQPRFQQALPQRALARPRVSQRARAAWRLQRLQLKCVDCRRLIASDWQLIQQGFAAAGFQSTSPDSLCQMPHSPVICSPACNSAVGPTTAAAMALMQERG